MKQCLPRHTPHRWAPHWVWFMLGSLIWLGCSPANPITEVTLPREQTGLPTPRAAMAGMPAQPEGPRRMIVAMIERPEAAWFFKLDGPPNEIAVAHEAWESFMQQVQFDSNGEPAWTLPADWKELPPRPQRFATLVIPAGAPSVELVVSSLPAGQSVLGNVNRWLGQLGMPPTDEAGLIDFLSVLPTESGEYLIFDQTITGDAARPGPEAPQARTERLPHFEAPAGWRFLEASPFVVASYARDFGGPTAQIAVSRLPAAGMDWDAVVGMWLEQVSLPADDLPAWIARTESIEVGGKPARRVALLRTDPSQPALLGIRVDAGLDAWYFKLFGAGTAVEQGRADFEKMLDTVRFVE